MRKVNLQQPWCAGDPKKRRSSEPGRTPELRPPQLASITLPTTLGAGAGAGDTTTEAQTTETPLEQPALPYELPTVTSTDPFADMYLGGSLSLNPILTGGNLSITHSLDQQMQLNTGAAADDQPASAAANSRANGDAPRDAALAELEGTIQQNGGTGAADAHSAPVQEPTAFMNSAAAPDDGMLSAQTGASSMSSAALRYSALRESGTARDGMRAALSQHAGGGSLASHADIARAMGLHRQQHQNGVLSENGSAGSVADVYAMLPGQAPPAVRIPPGFTATPRTACGAAEAAIGPPTVMDNMQSDSLTKSQWDAFRCLLGEYQRN